MHRPPERYRSGHNGADSKSDGRVKPARGFESHPLRHLLLVLLCACVLAPSGPVAAQGAPAAPHGDTGAWTQQKFIFSLLGFQSRYSCFALRDYVKRVLLALGARAQDLDVHPVACGLPGPPSVAASFWQLRPLAAADAARHGGRSVVPVHWEEVLVPFATPGHVNPDLSGCELAHQVAQRVIPYFVVRAVRFDPDCVEHRPVSLPFTLHAQVLALGAPAEATSSRLAQE